MATEKEYVIRVGVQSYELFRSYDLELAKLVYETVVDYSRDVFDVIYRVSLYEVDNNRINMIAGEEWGFDKLSNEAGRWDEE